MLVVKQTKNIKTKNDVLFFLHVERALVFCVIFYTRGTRSGIIMLYVPRVKQALALLPHIFPRV